MICEPTKANLNKSEICREILGENYAKIPTEVRNLEQWVGVGMKIDDYLKRQSQWVKAEYMAEYDIHDYPAISFASWRDADSQLKIMNRTRTKPLKWLGKPSPHDKSRVLYYPDSDFRQLWVRVDLGAYRTVAIDFLRKHAGVTGGVHSSLHADHLVARSKFRGKYKDGVTVLYFIPARANITWGAGYEKSTKEYAMKIRAGITLVSVAKAMGINGKSKSKNRTYADVAQDLIDKGISSMEYREERLYGDYSELEKVTSELGCAAYDRSVSPLRGRPTGVVRSENLLHRGAINALCGRVPEIMEAKLSDNRVKERRSAIDAWVTAHRQPDTAGRAGGLPLKSAFDMLLSDDDLFPMQKIVEVVEEAITPRGAAAYLMDKASVTGGAETFARHQVFQARDYNWQG